MIKKNKKKLLINYLNNLMKQKLLKKKKKIKIELADYIIFDIQQVNLNIFIELKNLKVIKNKGKNGKKILSKILVLYVY